MPGFAASAALQTGVATCVVQMYCFESCSILPRRLSSFFFSIFDHLNDGVVKNLGGKEGDDVEYDVWWEQGGGC